MIDRFIYCCIVFKPVGGGRSGNETSEGKEFHTVSLCYKVIYLKGNNSIKIPLAMNKVVLLEVSQ